MREDKIFSSVRFIVIFAILILFFFFSNERFKILYYVLHSTIVVGRDGHHLD